MKVGIYIRVSTQEQARDGYSVGEQRERLVKYCESMDWTVVKVYVDPGYSGATIDRPALKDMIEDSNKGLLDKIVVYKLDRLSRSQKDTLLLIEDTFLKNGTEFVSISENFDTSTPFGRAMVGILAVFAQLEREQIKERMNLGREARAKDGYYTGSNPPIGYDLVDGILVPNDYEVVLVRDIFNRFLSGEPINTIARILDSRGLYSRKGIPTNRTVERLLKNRHYIGEVKYADSWYKGRHEAILDEETFSLAQTLLERRKESTTSDHHNRSYLGGLVYCRQCGARYHRQLWKKRKDGTSVPHYMCYSRSKKVKSMVKDPSCRNKSYSQDDLDRIVLDEIRKLAIEPDRVGDMIEDRKRDIDNSEKTTIVRKEIENLTVQIGRLMDLYALETIGIDDIKEKIEPLTIRRQKLERELEDLYASGTETINEEEAVEMLQGFDTIIDRGGMEEIRLLISTLIRRIEIDEEDVYIYWNFL